MSDELTFNEALHEYFYKGKRVVSVTQIINHFIPFERHGLSDDELAYVQSRGRAAHKAYQLMSQGLEIEVDDAIQGHVEQWHVWKNTVKPEFIELEKMVYSPTLNVAGTLDGIVQIKNKMAFMDYKQLSNPVKTELQLGLYSLLYSQGKIRLGFELEINGKTWKWKEVNMHRGIIEAQHYAGVYNHQLRNGLIKEQTK